MWLHRVEPVRPPTRRARFASVGLAVLGVVGLGLAVVPDCGGGGSTGENVVRLQDAAPAALVVLSGSVAPDCGGGGTGGDD